MTTTHWLFGDQLGPRFLRPAPCQSRTTSQGNLGLLDPAECVAAAVAARREGRAPINSVEGFVQRIAGRREYVWQLYWYFGDGWRHGNVLGHHRPLPDWSLALQRGWDPQEVTDWFHRCGGPGRQRQRRARGRTGGGRAAGVSHPFPGEKRNTVNERAGPRQRDASER